MNAYTPELKDSIRKNLNAINKELEKTKPIKSVLKQKLKLLELYI